MLQPQIVEKPEFTVVGVEAAFIHALSPETTNFKVIGPLWQVFIRRADEIAGRIGGEMYGIIYGKPEAQRAHPHELQYVAGVRVAGVRVAGVPAAGVPAAGVPAAGVPAAGVPAAGVPAPTAANIPEGMVSHTVPAGTFAVFTHRGPIKTIGETIHEIYRAWLLQSAFRHAEIADVELYDQRFCVDSDDSEMECWISVAPKAPVA